MKTDFITPLFYLYLPELYVRSGFILTQSRKGRKERTKKHW